MDTMGIIWLAIYSIIGAIAIWKLVSAHRAKDNQKRDNNKTRYVNRVSKLKQRFSSIITNSASDTVDDNCGDNTENRNTDNSYPHSTSITGVKL
jgi:cytoskeletal protein RodZ